MRRLLFYVITAVSITFSAHPAFSQLNSPPVRLAVVAEVRELNEAADVLTAELSQRNDLQLLERGEIDKIRREQALSAANTDYLQLGKILGADGLLLLGEEQNREYLTARLLAVTPGVVLISQRFSFPTKDLSGWVKGFSRLLSPFYSKLSVQRGKAIPISIINFRAAAQSPEEREIEHQLASLTMERLSREPQFFLLERRRLNLLSDENRFSEAEDQFWKGSYLVDATVDRSGYSAQSVTVDARLSPPENGPAVSIQISGSRTNLPEAANQLCRKIAAALQGQSEVREWDAASEANRYFEEAKWAFRGELFEEAQAACETAWALGLQNSELAALRIRAYTDDALPKSMFGSVDIQQMPKAEKLGIAIRAAELFCQESRRVFTDAASPDEDWYDLGLDRVLRVGSAMLGSFHLAAELRAGNESQLADLRGLTRQVAASLETNLPVAQRDGAFQNEQRFNRRSHITLACVEWELGGTWFERPEDAAPMFHRLIERGYHPKILPQFAAWNWNDRKRIHQITRQFVEELCHSSNPAVRLEGLYLALVLTPVENNGLMAERQRELFDAMWEQREQIWGSEAGVTLIDHVNRQLLSKYYVWGSQFDLGSFPEIRLRLMKDYLEHCQTWNYEIFSTMFPSELDWINPSDAESLIPQLEAFQKWADAANYSPSRIQESIRKLRALTNTNAVVAHPVSIAEQPKAAGAKANADSITSDFIPWNLPSELTNSMQTIIGSTRVRNGQVWFFVHHLQPSEALNLSEHRVSYSQFDPATGRGETFLLPRQFGVPDGGFEVSSNALLVSAGMQIARLQLSSKTWSSIPLPTASGGRLQLAGGQLYVTTADSFLKVNPETGTAEILASSRRRPVINELDPVWNSSAQVFLSNTNSVRVRIRTNLFVFNSTDESWALENPTNLALKHYSIQSIPWAENLMLQNIRTGAERFILSASDESSGTIIPLLVSDYFYGNYFQKSLGPMPVQPGWNWSSTLPLDACLITGNSKELSILAPRWMWPIPFGRREEPAKFDDDRIATFIRFEPEFREPLSVPVLFRKKGAVVDSFSPDYIDRIAFRGNSGLRLRPELTWVETSDGFVFTAPLLQGHWFLSKSNLEERFEKIRSRLRDGNRKLIELP